MKNINTIPMVIFGGLAAFHLAEAEFYLAGLQIVLMAVIYHNSRLWALNNAQHKTIMVLQKLMRRYGYKPADYWEQNVKDCEKERPGE